LVTHQTLMLAVLPEADEADEVVEEEPQAAAKVATPTAATSSDHPLRGDRSFRGDLFIPSPDLRLPETFAK
jgi:hypothetical protein